VTVWTRAYADDGNGDGRPAPGAATPPQRRSATTEPTQLRALDLHALLERDETVRA
jgi:hypothetical protein